MDVYLENTEVREFMIREWREDELQISESFRQLANMLEEHEANMVHTEITEEEEIAIKFAIKQSIVNKLVLTVNAKIVCSQHDLADKNNHVNILESQDSKTSKNGIGLLSDIDTQLSHPFSGCKGRTDHVCKPDLMGWFDYDTTNKVGFFLGGDVMYGLTEESYMICKSGQGYLYASSSGQRSLPTEDGIFEDIKITTVTPMVIEFIIITEENGVLREKATRLPLAYDGKGNVIRYEDYYTIGYGIYLEPGKTVKFSETKTVTVASESEFDLDEYEKLVRTLVVTEEEALYAIDYLLQINIPDIHDLENEYNIKFRQCEFDALALLAYNTPAALNIGSNRYFHRAIQKYIENGRPSTINKDVNRFRDDPVWELLEEFGSYRMASDIYVAGVWRRSVSCGLIFLGYDYTVYEYSTTDGLAEYVKKLFGIELHTRQASFDPYSPENT